ncbi:MAG: NADP-dependent phosphogluconate dehydrogenase [Bifidobacterium sp.]|uniref:NADP-dependent phosphogluconate dehydrogenase n=1 Tax=Bifidobacterium sp. TaxID=41200 RepID=UPI0039EC8D40
MVQAQIGVYGLGVMGGNLARNLAHHGNSVAVFNRTPTRTRHLITAHGSEGTFVPAETIEDFLAALKRPRTVIIMVKAGAATDAVIKELADAMEPGDIIVDGGNSYFKDTIRREKEARAQGLHFVGMGISGGEEGALNGPSIMPGGTEDSWKVLEPILKSIAAVAEGEPCVTHIGENGAGHFVKMVHNGIEYADMQLIAESYDLLRRGMGMTPSQIADVFAQWNLGELNSYLIEITSDVLRQVDARTGLPFVDVVLDEAGMKGTGTWTVQTALDLAIPVTSISESVFARGLSGQSAQRAEARKINLPGPDFSIAQQNEGTFVEEVRKALYASKIVAYAQGFDEIAAGAQQYGWNIDLGAVARIWRGGCIIRAEFLDRISDAYASGRQTTSLLFDPSFKTVIGKAQDSWRAVISLATQGGIPIPGFTSSLAYYDGLRSPRLPTSLIQGQRDLFGAHTYRKVGVPGVFHTLWADTDRQEIQQN